MKRWMSILLTLFLLLIIALPVNASGSPGSDPPQHSLTRTVTSIDSTVASLWVPTPTDIDIGERIVDLSAMRTTTATPTGSGISTEAVAQTLFVLLLLSVLLNIYLARRVSEHTPREPPETQFTYDDFPPEGWM